MNSNSREGGFLFLGVAAAIAGAALIARPKTGVTGMSGYEDFHLSQLIDPTEVEGIADQLPPGTGDNFILAAWQYVGQLIPYEGYGSDVTFLGTTVHCARCLLPQETLAREKGNCMAKAVLLASILRNRLGPDFVFVAVGDYGLGGNNENSGHAWVEVFRGQDLYILESTRVPGPDPWMRAVDVEPDLYRPQVYLNDSYMECNSPELCIKIPTHSVG